MKTLNLYVQPIINSGSLRFLARPADSSRVNKLASATIKISPSRLAVRISGSLGASSYRRELNKKRFQEDYFNYKVGTISSTYIPTSKSKFTNPFIVDLGFNVLVALLGGTATYSDSQPASRASLIKKIGVHY